MDRWLFPLRRIEQEEMHGCGIAVVATVCGVTYARARAEFFPRRFPWHDDPKLHVSARQMQRVIRRLGFSTVLSPTFERARRPTILVFEWMPWARPDTWCHSVVWDPFKKKILDPGLDAEENHPLEWYTKRWKRSGFAALLVTGKRHG